MMVALRIISGIVAYVILACFIGNRLRVARFCCPPVPTDTVSSPNACRAPAPLPVTVPQRMPSVGILVTAMNHGSSAP